jgi:ParB family transcriptional regulator, chromosome partitioning protein
MTNVAEKTGDSVKEKPAVPEKRRALGRGLESLLPGPRVVVGSAVNPVAPRTPAAVPPALAPPVAPIANIAVENSSSQKTSPDLSSSSVVPSGPGAAPSDASTNGVTMQAVSIPTLSQSTRKDGAPTVDSGAAGIADHGPIENQHASPMAGLERAVVRNENTGTASVPTRVATHATHSSPGSQSSQTTETPTTGMGSHAPTLSQSARKDGPHTVSSATSVAEHKSQVSATERREPGPPSQHAVGDLQGAAEGSDFEGVQVTELPLDKIDPNPYQTRHFTAEDEDELIELGQSIKAQGLIQPITVREGKNGRYVLIAGDRRTRASRLAELKTIPAIIWDVTEQQAAEMTVIENLMREDLNCMDQTRAFMLLSSKFQMTQAEIASRMGMSRESVSNYMRLARLPQEVQDYLINNELEYSHARMLLKIDNDEVLVKVARKVAKEHIPVWELEEMMLSSNPTLLKPPDEKKERRGARWVDPNVRAAQRDLERVLGMRVRIRDRNNKGRIVIEYSTLEDFDRVVGALRRK